MRSSIVGHGARRFVRRRYCKRTAICRDQANLATLRRRRQPSNGVWEARCESEGAIGRSIQRALGSSRRGCQSRGQTALALTNGRFTWSLHMVGQDIEAITISLATLPVARLPSPKSKEGARIRFTSNILRKWARRTKSLDALLPVLYLRGISTGDFQEALAALLGKDAPNLSAAVIARLKSEWDDEYQRWQDRDLSARPLAFASSSE
jgi:Transposase, Mutator family